MRINQARTPRVISVCINNFTGHRPNNVTTIKDGADRVITHDTVQRPKC